MVGGTFGSRSLYHLWGSKKVLLSVARGAVQTGSSAGVAQVPLEGVYVGLEEGAREVALEEAPLTMEEDLVVWEAFLEELRALGAQGAFPSVSRK